jgi:hypothetical protein
MVVICGKDACNSVLVASKCRENLCGEVYGLPWVTTEEELVRNLLSNGGMPNRFSPCTPNVESLDAESIDVTDNLPGDVFGKMTWAMKSGNPVLNQAMKCEYDSPLYNRVMSLAHGSSYLVAMEDMDRFFPTEPLSAKAYAATTVAVRMRNTDEFAEESGAQTNEVDVVSVSEFLPGSVPLMGFVKVMTGKSVIGLLRPEEVKPLFMMPLFRHDKIYRLPAKVYTGMFPRKEG